MAAALALAFIVVPIVELYLFVQVASAIGFGWALVWIIGVSIAGAYLVKREGLAALRRANHKARNGEIPADELISGVLILFGGALMLTPGFLTDVLGLLLLLPPTRFVLATPLRASFAAGTIGRITVVGNQFGSRFAPGDRARGEVWDVESWEDGPRHDGSSNDDGHPGGGGPDDPPRLP